MVLARRIRYINQLQHISQIYEAGTPVVSTGERFGSFTGRYMLPNGMFTMLLDSDLAR